MSYHAFLVLFSAANVNCVRNGAKQSPAMFAPLWGKLYLCARFYHREGRFLLRLSRRAKRCVRWDAFVVLTYRAIVHFLVSYSPNYKVSTHER